MNSGIGKWKNCSRFNSIVKLIWFERANHLLLHWIFISSEKWLSKCFRCAMWHKRWFRTEITKNCSLFKLHTHTHIQTNSQKLHKSHTFFSSEWIFESKLFDEMKNAQEISWIGCFEDESSSHETNTFYPIESVYCIKGIRFSLETRTHFRWLSEMRIFPYSMAEDQPKNDAISYIMQINTIHTHTRIIIKQTTTVNINRKGEPLGCIELETEINVSNCTMEFPIFGSVVIW